MAGVDNVLLWLDAEPWRYWTLAGTCFGLTCVLALMPDEPARVRGAWSRRCFAVALLVTLAAFRWPGWFEPTAQNPDEAQVVASALTLHGAPVYWKYVDGTTHGPLCELLLVIAGLFGAPYSYITARVVAVLMQGLALWAVWGTLRCFVAERAARLGVLPGLAFWSFVTYEDYIHYSTELPGLLLIAWAGWAIAAVATQPLTASGAVARSFLAGLALGAVPFAKLQSVPQALALGLVGLGVFVRFRPSEKGVPVQACTVALLLGALTVPAIVAVYLGVFGLWAQFWYAYIESNLLYAGSGERTLVSMPAHFFHFVATGFSFAWFFYGLAAFCLLQAHRAARVEAALRAGVWIAFGLFVAAYATVLMPRREVAHYLHLLVVPGCVLGGLILGASLTAADLGRREAARVIASFLLLAVLPQVHFRWISWHPDLGKLYSHLSMPPSEAAAFIRERAAPGDTLAMWGWEPSLHVETGLPHATRDAHTAFQISETPLQAFYRQRYLRDLERGSPAWFVDATGPGAFVFDNRSYFGHETLPELAEYVAHHYTPVAEFGHRRIYRRNGDAPAPVKPAPESD